MIQFIHSLGQLVQDLLLIGLLGAGILLILALLSFVTRGLSRRLRFGSAGLMRYHDDTTFTRKPAMTTRLKACKTPECTELHKDVPLTTGNKPVAVLSFQGDLTASDRDRLARQIDEVIVNKSRLAGAVAVVASPGGGVSQYGQLYAEMERLRKNDVHLTVCVDTVAASGGYLMSLPANKIVAAPFAMVGSIGVVAQVPSVRKLLERLGIEGRIFTAGKFKRTVTTTGDDSPEAVEHFRAQLEAIHKQFIAAVTKYRRVDPDKVCTGDHWTAQESVEQKLGLVDEIATSQEYLFNLNQERDLVFIGSSSEAWQRRMAGFLSHLVEKAVNRISARLSRID